MSLEFMRWDMGLRYVDRGAGSERVVRRVERTGGEERRKAKTKS